MATYNGLDNLYSRLDVSERIPEALKLKNLSAASVVQGRKTAKFFPMNGSAFQYGSPPGFANSSQIITFRIADSQHYLDTESMYLNFSVQIVEYAPGTTTQLVPVNRTSNSDGTAWTVPEDSWASCLQRGRVLCNGVLVEDIQQLNSLVSALSVANANTEVTNKSLGVLLGSWRYNTDLGDSINGYSANAVSQRRVVAGGLYRTNVPATGTPTSYQYNTVSVSIPLSLLFDFNRGQYFPLRNAGAIQYEIYMDQVQNFILASLSSTAGTPVDVGVFMTNMYISADMLSLDPAYLQAMDRIMSSPEDGGYRLPINSYLVADSTYTVGPAPQTQKMLTWSVASPALRSILFWKKNPANSVNLLNYYISNFERLDQGNPAPTAGNTGSQLRIGSTLYPEGAPLVTVSELYRELLKMYGGFNLLNTNVLTLMNYCNMYGADCAATGVAGGNNNSFLWGLSFDKMTGVESHIVFDGIDNTTAPVISLTLSDCLPAGSASRQETCTAAILRTRFLVIAQGQVQMVG